jgi:hypothetical protein
MLSEKTFFAKTGALGLALFAALALAAPGAAFSQSEEGTTYLVFVTRAGQTLEDVAALPSHYGNALDWPLLYYLNFEDLAYLSDGPGNPASAQLKEGEWLAILTHDEAEKRLASRNANPAAAFVLHLFSTPDKEKAYEAAAKVIHAGHFAYIAGQENDGQTLFRVSTGFFESRAQAWRVQQELATILEAPEAWISQPTSEEFLRYAGHENP